LTSILLLQTIGTISIIRAGPMVSECRAAGWAHSAPVCRRVQWPLTRH
jgi:hypothetical protein